MRPFDWTDWGHRYGPGDFLGPTTADGPNSCPRGCKPCAIENGRRSRRGPSGTRSAMSRTQRVNLRTDRTESESRGNLNTRSDFLVKSIGSRQCPSGFVFSGPGRDSGNPAETGVGQLSPR
jgi:hypothetical protein